MGLIFFFRIKKSLFSFEARCRVLSDPTLACDTRVCLNHLLIILRADSVGEESAAAVAAAAALSVPIIWCVSPASSSLFLPRFPFFLSSFFPRLWRRSIITCTWWVSSVTTDESLSYFPVTVRIVPMNFNFNLSFPFNFLFFAVGIFLFELAPPPPLRLHPRRYLGAIFEILVPDQRLYPADPQDSGRSARIPELSH